MANYSQIFGSSGGIVSALSSASSILNYTTSLAERTAMGLYYQQFHNNPIKDYMNSNTLGLDFLIGDNIVSEMLKGGYSPHVGAYMAHKVGQATFQSMSYLLESFSPSEFSLLQKNYKDQLTKTNVNYDVYNNGINDPHLGNIITLFNTIESIHPNKFKDIFHNQMKADYVKGNKFLCILETNDSSVYDEFSTESKPMNNRHYISSLVKSITIPSTETSSIELIRFGKKLSLPAFSNFNESININYMIDSQNGILNKLYTYCTEQSFKNSENLYSLYIINNNPIQYFSKNSSPLSNIFSGGLKNPPELANNIIYSYKLNGVSVKNINQLTLDTSSADFMNFSVVFDFNDIEVQTFNYDLNKLVESNVFKFNDHDKDKTAN